MKQLQQDFLETHYSVIPLEEVLVAKLSKCNRQLIDFVALMQYLSDPGHK